MPREGRDKFPRRVTGPRLPITWRHGRAARPNPSRRAWPPSASSCPCSRTTFDPAGLEKEAARSRRRWGGPGSGTTRRPPPGPRPPTPGRSGGWRCSAGSSRDVADLGDLAEMAAEDEEMAAELDTQLRLGRGAPGRARRGAPVQRRVRRRRRGRHRPRRGRRHRLPGLGRDPPADVPALGRTARLRGRDAGGLGGGGGRAQVRHLHRPRRERLRPLRRRARRPPAGPDLPLRLLRPPPHQLRPGRSRAGGRRQRRGRDRRGRPADRHLPRLRRRRPARQQDRLGGADHPPPDRRRRPVPERALADPEQGGGDAAAALEADRAGGAQTLRRAGQGSAARSKTSPGARRSAAT